MQSSMRIAVLAVDVAQLVSIRQMIVAMGHECHSFPDGRGLLRGMRRQTFDLLILDWGLRYLPGLMVVRWIRQALANPLPILVTTTSYEEAEIVRGLDAGVNHFMNLPLRMDELEARVTALLRRAAYRSPFSDRRVQKARSTPAVRVQMSPTSSTQVF